MKKKRFLNVLLAGFMFLGLAGCSVKNAEEVSSTSSKLNGSYEETVTGHNGDLTVKVDFDNDTISNIEIVDHVESAGIADLPLEKIPGDIIANQSILVDTIAGATITSDSVIEAVSAAIVTAGGDLSDFENEIIATAVLEDIEISTDVVVIGAGGAGGAAAITAHQNGASVVILEKMPIIGGNTIRSGAAYNAVSPKVQGPLGVEDSFEKHFQQTFEGGDSIGDSVLIKILVEGAYNGVEWLESIGMEFVTDEIFTVLGGLWPRAHKPVMPLGTGYFETYQAYIDENNDIDLFLNTEATELIMDGERVVGVKAIGESGNNVVLTANNGVVIATGGFAANVDKRQKYNTIWSTLDDSVGTTNHSGATGDGIRMAKEVDAQLVGMEYLQMLPVGDPETGSLAGNIEKSVENRIFINKEGNRFVDEGARRDVMTEALLNQTDAYMWTVLDSTDYPTGNEKNNFNEVMNQLVADGKVLKGNTLEELAEKMGVPTENFVHAVEDYNQYVESGETDGFGRTLYQDKIENAPFYAGSRKPTVHHTMGGLKINPQAQVLDNNDNVINGLYAAGEVTGGIHGKNRLGGNALADIIVFGRIAGEQAATN